MTKQYTLSDKDLATIEGAVNQLSAALLPSRIARAIERIDGVILKIRREAREREKALQVIADSPTGFTGEA